MPAIARMARSYSSTPEAGPRSANMGTPGIRLLSRRERAGDLGREGRGTVGASRPAMDVRAGHAAGSLLRRPIPTAQLSFQ